METKPNFPSQWNRGTPTAKPPRKPPSKLRGLVAFLILIALAGGAAWYLLRDQGSVEVRSSEPGRVLIKEVKPAVQKPAAPAKKKGRELDPNSFAAKLMSGKQFTNEYGYVYNIPPDPNAKTNYLDVTENEYLRQHFKNDIDYHLANLISTEPGEDILGDLPSWYKSRSFVRAFEKSMNEPIIIRADDPADIQELKRALMDTKEELHQRIKAGENVGDIIEECFKEMKQLGAYREDIEAQFKDLTHDHALSKEDMEDFLTAANKMLAERGIAPMKMPKVSAARFRYLARRQQLKENTDNEN